MKKIAPLILSLLFLSLAACSSSSGTTDDDNTTGVALQGLASCTAQEGAAVICGTVYAADGVTPVSGATISRVSSSSSLTRGLKGLVNGHNGTLEANDDACVTDDIGAFACLVEEVTGETEFQITGSLFSTAKEFTATLTSGSTTSVDAASTTASSSQSSSVKWLVVPGSFDGVQLLLSQLKGCDLTGDESDPAELRSSTTCDSAGLEVLDDAEVTTFLGTEDLSNYQAIFVNCGNLDFSGDTAAATAVQEYINEGGNIYFSDLADDTLTTLFPNLVTYPADKNSTSSGTLSDAAVVDEGLQVFLGSSSDAQETMSIEFDLSVWTAMSSVVTGWTTYIQGDISSLAPTMSGIKPITVGGPQEDGCIFYTSYHVEAGQAAGADQELALKYLVLNRMNNCD